MNITTKFNLNDRRWFINRMTLKVDNALISELRVTVGNTFDSLSLKPYYTSVIYTLNDEKFTESEIERKTFASKEELLASL